MPSDPTAGTLLSGRKTARVRAPVVAATGACLLSPTAANVARNTSLYRPDVCFVVKLSTAAGSANSPFNVAAWPNPATDHFFIRLPQGFSSAGLQVSLYDCSGRRLQQAPLRSEDWNNVASIQAGRLDPGLYWWRVQAANGQILSGKIVFAR
jgi:hypothetical protein